MNINLSIKELGQKALFLRSHISAVLLLLLAILTLTTIIEFFALGLARKTFVFYTIDTGVLTLEERMLRVSRGKTAGASHREIDLTRYVEEALLGPVSPNSLPLFPRETRLLSLLFRDGVVYANLSEEAALPPVQGGDFFTNVEALYSGIKRNFPFVQELRFFIAGKPAFADIFR